MDKMSKNSRKWRKIFIDNKAKIVYYIKIIRRWNKNKTKIGTKMAAIWKSPRKWNNKNEKQRIY